MSSPSEGECWIQDSDHMDEYRGRVMDCDVNVLPLANKDDSFGCMPFLSNQFKFSVSFLIFYLQFFVQEESCS